MSTTVRYPATIPECDSPRWDQLARRALRLRCGLDRCGQTVVVVSDLLLPPMVVCHPDRPSARQTGDVVVGPDYWSVLYRNAVGCWRTRIAVCGATYLDYLLRCGLAYDTPEPILLDCWDERGWVDEADRSWIGYYQRDPARWIRIACIDLDLPGNVPHSASYSATIHP